MKLKTISLVALLAGIHSAGAFGLDFSNLDLALDGSVTAGNADGQRLVLGVEGFGNVTFGTTVKGDFATLDDNNGVAALEFDSSQTISISFISGSEVENIVVEFVGPDASEAIYTAVNGDSGFVTLPSGSAGIANIEFDRVGPKVPEPSTALLGGLGLLALLRRRR